MIVELNGSIMLPPIAGIGIPKGGGGGDPFGTGPDGATFTAGAVDAIGAANADAGVNHCPPTLILLRRPISYFGVTKKKRIAGSHQQSRKTQQ